MSTTDEEATLEREPWTQLARWIESEDSGALTEYLDSLSALDTVRAVSHLSDEQRGGLFLLVQPEAAADLMEQIPESQAVDALERLEPEASARILEELPSNEQADLIGELEAEDAEAILAEMTAVEADEVRTLAAYSEGTAGSLMITEYLRFDSKLTVGEVIEVLRAGAKEYSEYDVLYGYLVDDAEQLVGVLRLRDLLLAPSERRVARLVMPDYEQVHVEALLPELVAIFDEHDLFAAPVVDADGRLVGVLRRAEVEEAVAEESDEAFRRTQGIAFGEELRSMPLFVRSGRRLTWLSVNVLLNVAAASVIAMHQETLEAVIALAVFLPIISDMSGCSGSQAVAVSIRELTLNVIQPEDLWRVLGKELGIGLLNGAALGVLLGGVAWAWQGEPWLGVVAGGALALNTIVSVCMGGCIPLVLKRLGKDPALASGPILTTVTDACGFWLVLTLASSFLIRAA